MSSLLYDCSRKALGSKLIRHASTYVDCVRKFVYRLHVKKKRRRGGILQYEDSQLPQRGCSELYNKVSSALFFVDIYKREALCVARGYAVS